MIRLWNYSKTPGRGLKDFTLLVDDLLIYSGRLPMVTRGGILPTCTAPAPHSTILFSDSSSMRQAERAHLLSQCATDQDVMLTNDNQIVTHYAAQRDEVPDQRLRPTTGVARQSYHTTRRH